MQISEKLRGFLRKTLEMSGPTTERGKECVAFTEMTMVSGFLIPKSVWKNHDVLRLLGWSREQTRYDSVMNRIVLPANPLSAVLSRLAMAPIRENADQRGGAQRFGAVYAQRQLDILLHEYKNQHWSDSQKQYGEDIDWLADKFRRMLQSARMGLDRRYACYVKQRSLSPEDPLNPVVILSQVLFSSDVHRAVREMEVMEEEFHHGPQSSYDRVVDLCSDYDSVQDGTSSIDDDALSTTLRCATSRFSERSWETEDQLALVLGIEPDLYHYSEHAHLVERIEEWLKLADLHPLEVFKAAVAQKNAFEKAQKVVGRKMRLSH